MKAKDLREKSDKELLKLKKELSYQLVKAKSKFGMGQAKSGDEKKKKKEYAETKGLANQGMKTSLRRDIRRNIARINLILHERKIIKAVSQNQKIN